MMALRVESQVESLAKWLSCNGEPWGVGPTLLFGSAAAFFLYQELEAAVFVAGDQAHVSAIEKGLISTMFGGMLMMMVHLWVCSMRFFQYYLDTLIKDSPVMILEMTTAGLLGSQAELVPLGPLTRFLRQQQPQIHITVCWFLSLCYADYVRKHYCQRYNMPYLEQWQAGLHTLAARCMSAATTRLNNILNSMSGMSARRNNDMHTVRPLPRTMAAHRTPQLVRAMSVKGALDLASQLPVSLRTLQPRVDRRPGALELRPPGLGPQDSPPGTRCQISPQPTRPAAYGSWHSPAKRLSTPSRNFANCYPAVTVNASVRTSAADFRIRGESRRPTERPVLAREQTRPPVLARDRTRLPVSARDQTRLPVSAREHARLPAQAGFRYPRNQPARAWFPLEHIEGETPRSILDEPGTIYSSTMTGREPLSMQYSQLATRNYTLKEPFPKYKSRSSTTAQMWMPPELLC